MHPLRSFPPQWYVFRDDELSFSISGSKVRKYTTLVPFLIQKNIQHAILIGGAASNNVCGLAQLLIQVGITPHVFVREHAGDPKGNALLLRVLIPPDRYVTVPRSHWSSVELLADQYAQGLDHAVVVPEGANHPAAWEGAATLAEDIAAQVTPNHILIDAGTGFQARALCARVKEILPETHVHVVLIAGKPFAAAKNVHFYRPHVGRSFGSTPKAVFTEISRTAREEGFFLDPIYSAKLFMTARTLTHLEGTVCIVHSGGGIALFGYPREVSDVAVSANTIPHNHM